MPFDAPVQCRDLALVRNPGDHIVSGRVVLDDGMGGTPQFQVDVAWIPQTNLWLLSLKTAGGAPIGLGLPLRDRTDCLLGVSTPGRPAGALFPYDPGRRGDPTLDSFYLGTARLYYAPLGLPLGGFAVYLTQLV